MFSIPGFDPKTLTNEDLFEKQLDLTRRSLTAARFGKVEMVNQIQIMIQAIEMERHERMFNERIGSYILSSSPIVLETDPDLREKQLVTEESEQAAAHPTPARLIRRPVRTSKPVKPTDGAV